MIKLLYLTAAGLIAMGTDIPPHHASADIGNQQQCQEWRSVSGRVLWHGAPALSDLNYAPVTVRITDVNGESKPKGGYLMIRNYSSHPIYFTSNATGDHNQMVAPRSTRMTSVASYRRPDQDTMADLAVRYCAR